ncbi:hydantoinase B/oxoprolinase family protein [Paraburkholderia phenoliruptrix]|uniref:hydantoinase B/oxoprolinase family protein n=1 Tax=Paraburkholderia phenoliruptrix TaxID=252970 RepID=UPI002869CB5B|nr:hydantoinase B/oxoprolinase family protein [Paraburkholderia phenoliruptrix]WMY10923.1 hydantoinase B/oxoprolinase family protein [Paraburkholderia phenoliruptrix]
MIKALKLTLLQKQLDHISVQMGWVMQRTARSPIFSESHDFSCFISDAEGMLVSVADGIPIHTGSGGSAVAAILRDWEGDISPGDVFILSDPYEAGGNHLPDWTILNPVFYEGELIAFTCNRAHQSDIGGGAAGTYNANATEIFHEGIRLPTLKLIEAGKVRQDLWRLLKLNSRCPELIDGDLQAMIGSTRIGAERLVALASDVGSDALGESFDAILTYAESRMRAAIAEIPNGEYYGVDSSNTDCFSEVDVPVRVKVSVRDEELTVDFTGSAPQILGFKNSSLANTHSAVYVGLLALFDSTLPKNAGSFRPITIIAPEGSVVNARSPAPMTSNTVYPATEIIYAIWKALGTAMKDRACAGWGKASHCISSGVRADETTYVMYHMHAYPGAGAVRGRDGFNSLGTVITLGGMQLPNVEVFEKKYPVRIVRQEFRRNAAGAGEFRGGTGIDYEALILSDTEVCFRGEGLRTASGFGIAGGKEGAMSYLKILDMDGNPIETPQYGVKRLPACRVQISSSAGGGWGNPKDRSPERVRRDLLDGIIDETSAVEVYGYPADRLERDRESLAH